MTVKIISDSRTGTLTLATPIPLPQRPPTPTEINERACWRLKVWEYSKGCNHAIKRLTWYWAKLVLSRNFCPSGEATRATIPTATAATKRKAGASIFQEIPATKIIPAKIAAKTKKVPKSFWKTDKMATGIVSSIRSPIKRKSSLSTRFFRLFWKVTTILAENKI